MRGDALQFGHQHAQHIRPFGNFCLHQFFDGETVDEIVADVVEVVESIRHHQCFDVGLRLHVLFNTGMQKANVRDSANNGLTVELDDESQHAVCAGMLRSHIQHHRLTA